MAVVATQEIVKPVAVLAAWTMVMLVWLYVSRTAARDQIKVDPRDMVGGTSWDVDRMLSGKANWAAHNYNHLHEAPTVFYAVALLLALMGQGNGIAAALAWAYVALRIVHSVWQATVNRILVRLALFGLSSLVLMALTLLAVKAAFGF
ncbi:MAPEG family protein [Sphingobium sp. Sx8-8]|uniref:MAPEG family protein n=1 Tax=Sphingobium sp. Sx8-8 TaxID=2933617 RepID=UPI001F591924|nr:MAPEG family protein [Sphingobium sp. Sx8-8]